MQPTPAWYFFEKGTERKKNSQRRTKKNVNLYDEIAGTNASNNWRIYLQCLHWRLVSIVGVQQLHSQIKFSTENLLLPTKQLPTTWPIQMLWTMENCTAILIDWNTQMKMDSSTMEKKWHEPRFLSRYISEHNKIPAPVSMELLKLIFARLDNLHIVSLFCFFFFIKFGLTT